MVLQEVGEKKIALELAWISREDRQGSWDLHPLAGSQPVNSVVGLAARRPFNPPSLHPFQAGTSIFRAGCPGSRVGGGEGVGSKNFLGREARREGLTDALLGRT